MIEVRSYRRVFDLERRIYSVDRVRLNPGGVPVRGVLYFLTLLAVGLVAWGLPLIGSLSGVLPWFVRDLALPGAGAAVLSVIRIEGRVFHLAAQSLVRYWTAPRRLVGVRRCESVGDMWRPEEILLLPDGSDHHMRGLRYTGPGAVLVSVEHERHGRARELGSSGIARAGLRPVLSLRQKPGAQVLAQGQVISLGVGARLRVRSSSEAGIRA
ncbi:MAG TPA: hypothetical protein VK680_05665 [Solirubrobacteraceae bacterium]|jgi:hypothetical protein|nr:hypothetical protein [Solirubrobacteraceae bacterium]